jgi:hypothetical protein
VGDEVFIQLGDALGGHLFASLEQHFEPHDEASDIERLTLAGATAHEQILVERLDELLRRRQRDELTGVFDPNLANQRGEGWCGQRPNRSAQIG